MIYEVEIDTGLYFGPVILEIEAKNEKEAKDLAIKQCLKQYSKEYKDSRDAALSYKLRYRNIIREMQYGIY